MSGILKRVIKALIFLDEVVDMSPAVQRRVLRLLKQYGFERVGGIIVNRLLATESSTLYAETWEQKERCLVTRVLQGTEINQTTASEIVGITRGTIRNRVTLFQMTVEIVVSIEK